MSRRCDAELSLSAAKLFDYTKCVEVFAETFALLAPNFVSIGYVASVRLLSSAVDVTKLNLCFMSAHNRWDLHLHDESHWWKKAQRSVKVQAPGSYLKCLSCAPLCKLRLGLLCETNKKKKGRRRREEQQRCTQTPPLATSCLSSSTLLSFHGLFAEKVFNLLRSQAYVFHKII